MFGRLAMGFANVRASTRVLMLVLVLVQATIVHSDTGGNESLPCEGDECTNGKY